MNAALVRLMWKEYRVLRGFWLALAVFGLFCDALILILVANPQDRLPGLFGLAGMLPICFALGAGATVFAVEREESTRDFLRYLPITSLRIFASKIVMAFVGTLLLTAVLLAVAICGLANTFGNQLQARAFEGRGVTQAVQIAPIYAVVSLHAMGWGVLFSLKSARPLLAAFLGAIAAAACLYVAFIAMPAARVLAAICGFRTWGPFGPQSLVTAWLVTAPLATAAVWMINVYRAGTWLHDRRAVARFDVGKPSPRGRLVWQEWRGSRRTLAALYAVGVLFPLLSGPAFIPATAFVLALFGSCTFLGDQEQRQFRFFAERGISPRTVWGSRQLFWGGAMLVLAAVLFWIYLLATSFIMTLSQAADSLAWFVRPNRILDVRVHGIVGCATLAALSFGAGQLSSIFLRSGLLASAFAVILAELLLAWALLMQYAAIGWWWSVAPLAIALFAATWLRSTGWILERKNWRAWLPAAFVLIVPVLSLLAAVPAYRVWQIPEPEAVLSIESTAPPSAEANAAARRFFELAERLPLRQEPITLPSLSDPRHMKPTAQEWHWLRDNEAALDKAIEELANLPADATVEGGSPRAPVYWQQLAAMMIRHAQMAEGQDDLDEAWRRYQAVFELTRFMRRGNGAMGEVLGGQMETAALAQLPRWGARKGQTVERLRAALSEVDRLDKHDERLADVIRQEYRQNLAALNAAQAHAEDWVGITAVIAKWAPWEFTRSRRLLEYVCSLYLLDAQEADAALAGPQAPLIGPSRAPLVRQAATHWQTSVFGGLPPDIFPYRRSVLCYRRGTQVALAVEAWRLEHGELPETLVEMGDLYFTLRADPYNGQMFEWFPWGLKLAASSQNVSKIPAGTPLIFGQGANAVRAEHLWIQFDRLRRRSADDPILRFPSSPAEGSGIPSMGAAGPGEGGVGVAGAAAAAVPVVPPGPSPASDSQPMEYLDGLTFPIPMLPDGESNGAD